MKIIYYRNEKFITNLDLIASNIKILFSLGVSSHFGSFDIKFAKIIGVCMWANLLPFFELI